jgi:hypothetical protein
MSRTNIWLGYVPSSEGDIERQPIKVLWTSAKPAALWRCSDLHGCRACFGWGTRAGRRCTDCQGTGVGRIKPGDGVYCPVCSVSAYDGDPRLEIRPGERPKPEPKPMATTKPGASRKRGRPSGSKNKRTIVSTV